MRRPPELASDAPLVWSPGRGTDVWAMFQAAIAGDVGEIDRLLAADPSLARCHFEYRTPLMFAVRENRVEAAERLFDAGPADLGDPLEEARLRGFAGMVAMLERKLAGLGVSPAGEAVAEAIRARDAARALALIDASPEALHAADGATNRPIHWAVMTRQPDLVDALLDRGADIDHPRRDGARPIQLANGDYHYRGWRDVPDDVAVTPRQMLEHLRARGAYVDICTAAWIGDAARVRELLDDDPGLANRPVEYVSYYACSGTPLRNAAGAGHEDIVRMLLDAGADPNLPEEHIAPMGHALYQAVANGHADIARLLLERGAHPNAPVESSADTLTRALMREDAEMVELLRSYGAERETHISAYYGDLAAAERLFDADPSAADDPVALRHAAEEGHEAFVRLLLDRSPGLASRVGTVGRTRAITELLLERGMDPSHRDWLGGTPLHWLAEHGTTERAELLVARGADVEARDDELRSTPLGWAARAGRGDMVALLLGLGADALDPGAPPWATPLAWARRNGHAEVAAVLESHGARGTGPAI